MPNELPVESEEKAPKPPRNTTVTVHQLWGSPRSGEMLVRVPGTGEFRLIPFAAVPENAGTEFSIERSVFDSSPVPPFARSS